MGAFCAAVQQGRVPQPVQRGFSQEIWKNEYKKIDDPDEADKNLFECGIFFDEVLVTLRTSLAAGDFSKLERRSKLIALCALANSDVATLSKKIDAELEKKKELIGPAGTYSGIEPVNLNIELRSGIKATPDQITTILHDSIIYPLDEALVAAEVGENLSAKNFQSVGQAERYILGKNEEDAEVQIPKLLSDQPVVNDILMLVKERVSPLPIADKKIVSRYFSVSLGDERHDWVT